jgi:hypothetical protein
LAACITQKESEEPRECLPPADVDPVDADHCLIGKPHEILYDSVASIYFVVILIWGKGQ